VLQAFIFPVSYVFKSCGRGRKLSLKSLFYTFSFVSQISSKEMYCHQISNGNDCILIIVHCHVVSIPRIVTQFVNFDTRLLPVLGNITPVNNSVFEFKNYLDCQML
jgi:hypothetical protein